MIDKIRNAAIILLGVGDKCAGEILKNMTQKEVRAIIEAINNIGTVTEEQLLQAMNDFFKDSNAGGIDAISREQIKNSLLSVVGHKGMTTIVPGINSESDRWLDIIAKQPIQNVVELLQDEHPQIITGLVVIMFNYLSSDIGTEIVKAFPRNIQTQVFKRMSNIGPISKVGIDIFSRYFDRELTSPDVNTGVAVDGLDTIANIISFLDSESEQEILKDIGEGNKLLTEKIQDRIFPFKRLAEMDKKSMQTFVKEIPNEDLILALKGVDERVKSAFLEGMSTKSAEIFKDEMESRGPVKVVQVLDAQKRIIVLAKKMSEEEKILLSNKNKPDVVF